jgi:hypothetical protein
MNQVIQATIPNIENAHILVSAVWDDNGKIHVNMSFLYDSGNVAAEWEPRWGPIQLWYRVDENHEHAKAHYFYDHVDGSANLAWSQLAVDREGLQGAFVRGDYTHIFRVLKRWAE